MTTTRFPNEVPHKPEAPEQPAADGPPPDHSRAGAIWVTATGAFLLFAASAVFVAVQWSHLANEVKLGILGAMTGTCLLAGRRVRPLLPATAGVIYHLGAFLIPVNVAAVLVNYETPWASFLLIEGIVAAVAWTVLNQVEHSSVLRWSAAAAVVASAGGVAATTGAPAALLVAGAAAIAELARRRGEAISWAIVAGAAPVLALAEDALPFGTDVVAALGLAGDTPRLTGLASGALATIVLARNAQRRQDLLLVVLAALAAAIGLLSSWVGLTPDRPFNIVGAATLFVAVEMAAFAVRRDTFWSRPGHVLGLFGEGIVALATPIGFVAAAWALVNSSPRLSWSELIAGVLVAAGWFVADLRRRVPDSSGMAISLLVGGGWMPATLGMTSALAIGVTMGTASPTVVAIGAVAVAALLVLGGRPWGHAVAAMLTLTAPVVAAGDSIACAVVGVAGAVVLATAAVVRAHMGDRADNGPLAWVTAAAAMVPIVAAHLALRGDIDQFGLLVGTALAAWLVATILDRAADAPGMALLGMVGRIAAVGTLLAGVDATLIEEAWLAGMLSALAMCDALRRRQPSPLLVLPITVPALVGASAHTLGLSIGETGVALSVLAAIAAGIHLLLEDDWRWPVLGVVLAAAVSGFTLASTSLPTASTALIVLGGVGLAYSTVFSTPEGFVFSGAAITAGIWGHLAHGQVTALDAYVAPVAVMLVVAGYRARAGRVSSWVAFGPAIVLLGGSALLERFNNGPGIHALVAGAVGVAAVLVGGSKRLISPLVLGTAVLVGLTAHESLGVTREVPTWGWLALGGVVLLAAGVTMERLDTGPLESGRRVVDMVGERFS